MGRWSRASFAALLLVAAGCSKSPTVPAVPGVHGTVTSGGVAVAGARIYVLLELEDVPAPAAARSLARGAGRDDDGPVPPPIDALFVWPNPVDAIGYIGIAVASADRGVLEVLDRQGRHLRWLADRAFASGLYTITWTTVDDAEAPLPGGFYVVRWRTGFASTPKTLERVVLRRAPDVFSSADLVTDASGAFVLPDVSGVPGDTVSVTDVTGQRTGVQRFTGNVILRAAIGESTATLKTAERTVSLVDIRRGVSITLALP